MRRAAARRHRLARRLLDGAAAAAAPLPVPPSWPAGDPYLLRNEAPLPGGHLPRHVPRPAAAGADRRRRWPTTATCASPPPTSPPPGRRSASRAPTSSPRSMRRAGRPSPATPTITRSACRSRRSRSTCSAGCASLTRADQQRLFATEAGARAVRLALVGDIADAWLAYAADSSLLDHRRRRPPRAPRRASA